MVHDATKPPQRHDRIAEATANLQADIIVNVQGDEPEIDPGHIDRLVHLLREDDEADMATLAALFQPQEDVNNPNVVKVVVDRHHHALYFSRWPIPFCRDEGPARPAGLHRKHLGLYAYRQAVLGQLSSWPPTPLEQAEKLEQLRALENGLVIAVADVEHQTTGIDTLEQYRDFVKRYQKTNPTRNGLAMPRRA
jgi:3-deoxy-manno-octulosonate cytidylyltransferase (CMP-KDO synthetase)